MLSPKGGYAFLANEVVRNGVVLLFIVRPSMGSEYDGPGLRRANAGCWPPVAASGGCIEPIEGIKLLEGWSGPSEPPRELRPSAIPAGPSDNILGLVLP